MKCKEVSVELQCGFKNALPALILQVHNREAVSDREWGFADKMSEASACIWGRLLRFPPPCSPLLLCLGVMLGADIEKRVAVLRSRAWDRAAAQAVAGFNLVTGGSSSAEDVSAWCRALQGPVCSSLTCVAVTWAVAAAHFCLRYAHLPCPAQTAG